ncbi:cytochrome c [Vibrio sp. ZSDE26]|uniref:Cytochrome c n=1 Tax=Vibrio amylolyticus TaxID=2847292 RepID=A0A9X1XKA5_9VIBR|nr:cytochrome c [Vibrio amylolyticus]MCK6263448.1 cytochrome c [Vibrio amylolyticus]
MKTTTVTLLILFGWSANIADSNATPFGDPELGKLKAPSCVFCHGKTGISTNPSYPNIQGQNELYLYNAMKAYQNGERTGPLSEMMGQQLQRLNDQDLKDVASYFSQAE